MIGLLAALVLSAAPKEYLNVGYAANGSLAQRLDLYVPQAPAGKEPLVVWIHGGGWRSGSKVGGPWRSLLIEGFAVASIDYRLSGEAVFPAQIEDCKAAVRFLRLNAAKYGFDGSRIGVWGASAGGHLAALLGTSGDVKALEGASLGNEKQSSRVQAVCDFYGPIDFIAMHQGRALENDKSAEALLLGGALGIKRDLAKVANPTTYISRDDPPFLIEHGDQDRLVPISQSEDFCRALQSGGVSASFFTVPGAGHGNLGAPAEKRAVEFLKKQLGWP
jgi:acetyl esterase/lipase